MNPDPNAKQDSNHDRQWDIDRYLLLDPSFDRDAFEQQMLEDLTLAARVADSVLELHSIAVGARKPVKVFANGSQSIGASDSKRGRGGLQVIRRWTPWVAAATLFTAVSVWQFRGISKDAQLSEIADNWMAIEGLSTVETLELVVADELPTENHGEVEASEQTDWLVEAAREFYLAKNEGAAG